MKIGKYKRSKKHRILMSNSKRKGKSIEECFFEKVKFNLKCWVWTASKTRDGYGNVGIYGKIILTHRFSYELFNEKIKLGNEVHHICENPCCINPGHLEQMTNKEHLLLGNGPGAINARKTHCLRGHPFSKINCYVYVNKIRVCRLCKNMRERVYYNRKREPSKRLLNKKPITRRVLCYEDVNQK